MIATMEKGPDFMLHHISAELWKSMQRRYAEGFGIWYQASCGGNGCRTSDLGPQTSATLFSSCIYQKVKIPTLSRQRAAGQGMGAPRGRITRRGGGIGFPGYHLLLDFAKELLER